MLYKVSTEIQKWLGMSDAGTIGLLNAKVRNVQIGAVLLQMQGLLQTLRHMHELEVHDKLASHIFGMRFPSSIGIPPVAI